MDQIKIGSFIAEKRKQKNMTQIEFAEKLGVTNKSVSRWENGKNMPDVSLFIPICELLGITVNELISGEEIRENEIRKTNEIIVETIKESNKAISKSRLIFYAVIVIVNALFSIAVPLTASPSDAMAVPLAAVLNAAVTTVLICCLNIKLSFKFAYIPISAVFFLIGSMMYYSADIFDYGLPYASIIAILQFVIILMSMGISKLIRLAKQKILNTK